MHAVSAYPFFLRALEIVRRKGRETKEYAYLLGFLCHYILDSESHSYVDEMIRKTGVEHVEIEEEFEKKLLRIDNKDPLLIRLQNLFQQIGIRWKQLRHFIRQLIKSRFEIRCFI